MDLVDEYNDRYLSLTTDHRPPEVTKAQLSKSSTSKTLDSSSGMRSGVDEGASGQEGCLIFTEEMTSGCNPEDHSINFLTSIWALTQPLMGKAKVGHVGGFIQSIGN